MEYAKEYEISVFEVTKDFGRIAELVVNGEIDAVIVHDFTRLTRDAMECHNKVHQFRGYGVTILATK